ncbi:MAG: hypothetical protein WBN40_06375, partial [Pseudomonadales bacterium]
SSELEEFKKLGRENRELKQSRSPPGLAPCSSLSVVVVFSRRIVGWRATTSLKRSPWCNVDEIEYATLVWVECLTSVACSHPLVI